jgi:hypothetical protein
MGGLFRRQWSISGQMGAAMDEKLALSQAALLFAAILALLAGALALLRRYRSYEANDTSESSQLMTKFRDLHEQGGLSDEEFRTIKTKLASQLKADMLELPRSASIPSKGQ